MNLFKKHLMYGVLVLSCSVSATPLPTPEEARELIKVCTFERSDEVVNKLNLSFGKLLSKSTKAEESSADLGSIIESIKDDNLKLEVRDIYVSCLKPLLENKVKPTTITPYIPGVSSFISDENGTDDPVDLAVKSLKQANIAFNTPTAMKKNETYLISLKLSSTKSVDDLLAAIEGDEKESAEVNYGNRMLASLVARKRGAFDIVSITSDEQAISSLVDETTWTWSVTPLDSGKKHLHLTLVALLDINGEKTPFQIKSFEKTIEVEVSALNALLDFIKASWEWIMGSLIFPLIVWLWKIRSTKNER